MNTPQHLIIPLGGSARIEAFDQLSHICVELYDGQRTLRSIAMDTNDLRAAALDLIEDVIDDPLPTDSLRPGDHEQPLLTIADVRRILNEPFDIDDATLESIGDLKGIDEALSDVFESLEEALLEGFPNPNGDDAKNPRRGIQAIRVAQDLFRLLAQRGA